MTQSRDRFGPAALTAAIVLLLVGYAGVRLALEQLYTLFDPDEALTMLEAQSILRGGLPYVDCYTHRGPVLSLLYAVPLALGGEYNAVAVHAFGVATVALVIAALVWQVARVTATSTAVIAGLLFVLLGTVFVGSDDTWGLNSDVFMAAFVAVGFLVVLGRCRPGAAPRALGPYCAAGVLLALAFLIKQNAALFAPVPLLFLLGADRERAAAKLGAYVAGFAMPCALVAGVYLATGEWSRFWYGFYGYNRQYAGGQGLMELMNRCWWLVTRYGVLAPIALAGLVAIVVRPRLYGARLRWLLVPWLGAAVLVAVAPGRPWDNYLWATHAPISLAGAFALTAPLCWPKRTSAYAVMLFGLLMLGVAWQATNRTGAATRRLRAVERWDDVHVGGIKVPAGPRRRDLVSLIGEHTTAEDTIYVNGYAPELYVLARRPYASRHVISNFVEGFSPGRNDVPLAEDAVFLEELTDDLTRTRPRLIIDACRNGYLCHPRSTLMEHLLERLPERYVPLEEWPVGGVYVRRD